MKHIIFIILFFACKIVNAQEVTLNKNIIKNNVSKVDMPNSEFIMYPVYPNNHVSTHFNSLFNDTINIVIPIQPENMLMIQSAYKDWTLSLSSQNSNMVGLGTIKRANIAWQGIYNNFSVSIYAGGEKYLFNNFYKMRNYNNFIIGGNIDYRLNSNWSVTVFGRYASNSFYYSMSAFPYITNSMIGGMLNYNSDNHKYGLSIGSRYTYDPFSQQWRFEPIFMPNFKIGKTKVNVDLGPLLHEGVRNIIEKHNKILPQKQ